MSSICVNNSLHVQFTCKLLFTQQKTNIFIKKDYKAEYAEKIIYFSDKI